MRRQRRCDRICRSQEAIHGPGLPAHLGCGPACQHGDEAERNRQLAGAQVPVALEQTAAAAQHPADGDECEHQQADADHDPEREEHDRHRGPLINGELLQTTHRPVERMGQDEAAEIRHVDRVPVPLGGLIGNRKQGQRHAGSGLPPRFDRRDLGRLVLARIETVLVPNDHLQRH